MLRFLLAALLLLVIYPSTAQEGLKITGLVTPTLSFSFNLQDGRKGETLRPQPSYGWNGGLLLGYGITEALSISTGVLYVHHQARFVHERQVLSDGNWDPNFGKVALRQSNYLRVPLLLELASDPNRRWGVMARVGPHFNFLLDARYLDERLVDFSNYDPTVGIDLTQEVTLYQENITTGGLLKQGGKARIYQPFVAGVTAEVGVQWRVSDAVKLTALLHVEGSSNPEAEGAASLAHNLNQGDYLVTADPFDAPQRSVQDAAKEQMEETPLDAVFPNFTDEAYPNVTVRAPTWQVMVGLQLGVVYTYNNNNK